VLRHVRAFSEIPLEQLEEIAQFFMESRYPKGHVFYAEDADETLHLLVEGEATVCMPTLSTPSARGGDGVKQSDERDARIGMGEAYHKPVPLMPISPRSLSMPSSMPSRRSSVTLPEQSRQLPSRQPAQRRGLSLNGPRSSASPGGWLPRLSSPPSPKEMLRPIHRLFKTGELFGEGGVFDNHAGGGLAVIADTEIATLWISKVRRQLKAFCTQLTLEP